jgi:two-component system nitrate/nitrite sensor histidine kinase NarX/two-component system sensor histidine kinase UhpB
MIQHKEKKRNYGTPDRNKWVLPTRLKTQQIELQLLAQNLLKVQEDERQHLSRELHDELGQWLTAISAETEAISNSIHGNSKVRTGTQSIKESVGKMHDVIHNIMHQLRPALLDSLGLEDSLNDLRAQWSSHNPDISCKFVMEGELNNFGEMINITIFRIIQESLNNICSHAEATRVLVHLNHKLDVPAGTNILLLSIEDNGKGYNPKQQSGGFGVLGMRERAIAAGGKFSLYSAPGHGTQINVSFPIEKACTY